MLSSAHPCLLSSPHFLVPYSPICTLSPLRTSLPTLSSFQHYSLVTNTNFPKSSVYFSPVNCTPTERKHAITEHSIQNTATCSFPSFISPGNLQLISSPPKNLFRHRQIVGNPQMNKRCNVLRIFCPQASPMPLACSLEDNGGH